MMDRTAHVTITAVAMGAGLLLGAVGVYIYESITQKKKNDQFQRSLSELKNEVKELRQLQNKRNVRRQRLSVEQSRSSVSTYDGDDDEFFDVEDELDSEDKIGFVDSQLKDFNGDKVKALHTLLELLEENEQDCQILWRLAMAYYQLSLRMEGEAKKEYVNKGIEFGKKALDVDPTVMEAHKYYAICVGARSEWQGTSDKIKDGMEFQKHVLEAMKIAPNDATLYHLLGRFQFEVSGLSWFQRKAAETLFGEVPTSTYDVALSSLSKADELSEQPWKENMVYIAKCYIELGKVGKAVEWLLKAKNVPAESPQEKKVEDEIKSLLRHYNG